MSFHCPFNSHRVLTLMQANVRKIYHANPLVVDDETDVRDLFQQRFRREIRSGELRFNFAFSGDGAMAFLRVHQSGVLIILSDINMPGQGFGEQRAHLGRGQQAEAHPFIGVF